MLNPLVNLTLFCPLAPGVCRFGGPVLAERELGRHIRVDSLKIISMKHAPSERHTYNFRLNQLMGYKSNPRPVLRG